MSLTDKLRPIIEDGLRQLVEAELEPWRRENADLRRQLAEKQERLDDRQRPVDIMSFDL